MAPSDEAPLPILRWHHDGVSCRVAVVCLQVLEDFGATSLQAYVRGGRLGLHDVLRVGIAVASALDHVHAGGLLHLDVSARHPLRSP